MHTIVVHVGLISSVDVVCKRFVKNPLVRWYFLHAFVNFVLTVLTWPSMMLLVDRPFDALEQQRSINGNMSLVILLHVYHILCFSCTYADYIHHGVFVTIAGVLVWNVPIGPVGDWAIFFACGLPGGIDYLVRGLVGIDLVEPNTRLRIATAINTWIRGPGMCCATLWFWLWLKYHWPDPTHTQSCMFIGSAVISLVNGQYYSELISYTLGVKSVKSS